MATAVAPVVEPTQTSKLVAPRWHTAALISLFLGLALFGAFFQRQARAQPAMLQQHPQVAPLYLSLIAAEWGLFYWVWKGGLRRTGTKIGDLIGGRWSSPKDVLTDFGIAIVLWGGWSLVERAGDRLMGPGHAASIQTLLPQRALEIVLWIGVSISAGFCEEFVFRGYFQRQFQALSHSRWIALFLQAVLFGIAHGYQGVQACVRIAIFGVFFGLFAIARKSLRPGMIAHAGGDILGGIFGI
jgi:membrane protease YdiL (CAAX protease family)